ncbi:glycosyltransferase family 39 protein [Leekyejoonella antrihumi]|uniref:Glycosyltransferase family 39 protein n=1 Tax=Leekyejoonella antrihumi TaxID=1660198 RepID=A0A563E0Q4_9MICO|nr:glycosyltransferase family 39 protein [Leekyejoonella antrihumi]TWP36096.1 glycosyltransferase family 39 protein [Leekyejoonella antrihumi]
MNTLPVQALSQAASGSSPAPREKTSRASSFWRGHLEDPAWGRPALLGLLALTGIAYFYNLTASGWANDFYSAAVQAGSSNWEAFFFGSSDAANSITVDKPPAALWIMALSVRAFGLSAFSILMPQVLMGIATVGVLYAAVRRYFGVQAGLIAGVVLALTPVAALMFRFNNPDALLVLLMTLAAYATLRATESGRLSWMIGAGVALGLGFLTKTLQVALVVPFLGIGFLIAARGTLRRRIVGAVVGVVALVLSAGWWVALVQLIPADKRPYIGGSQSNSFLQLTFGYNGFGRITGNETGSVGGGGGGGNSGGMWGQTGIARMFGSEFGGQISWLIPTALVLLAVGLVLRGRRPRTDLRRAAYLMWGGWLLVTALTFSFMSGIIHPYYAVALAPAVAALVGMGSVEAWEHRHSSVGAIALAVATAVAATWSFVLLSRTTAYGDWLRISVLAIGLSAALLLLAIRWVHRKAVAVIVGAALASGLAGPAAYTVTTVSEGHSGSIVSAGPSAGGGAGMGGGMPGRAGAGRPGGSAAGGGAARAARRGPTGATGNGPGTTQGRGARSFGGGGLLGGTTPSAKVIAALRKDASKYTWVAAAIGSQTAASLQLGVQRPVMPIGGFNGSDPSPTLPQFKAYVAAGKIHYFAASSGMGGSQMGGSHAAGQITSWVESHFTKVTIGSMTFYDLTSPTS